MSGQHRIGIVAIFLPRMELDHLREWIEYHLRIGVARIFLYNNGHLSVDPAFGQDREASRVWQKKPEANFHLEVSDPEIDDRVRAIVSEFASTVACTAWPTGDGHGADFMKCQKSAVNCELRRQELEREVEWLAHLDLDELLVSGRDLGETLAGVSPQFGAIRLKQRLFESRWADGVSVPYSQLTKSYGTFNFNHKLIVRVGRVSRWTTPHSLGKVDGQVWRPPATKLRFHHFRGNQHHGPAPPKGYHGVNKYCRIDASQLHPDSSHVLAPPTSNEMLTPETPSPDAFPTTSRPDGTATGV